jgi:hypothetical protein
MPARTKRSRRWLRISALIVALAAFLFLSGIQSWPDQIRGMRAGNENESFYSYVAQQLAEPAICDKVSWSAMLPGGFFLSPSYERSQCYDFIAGRTRNPWLCWSVRRLGAFSFLSEQTSTWTCLKHALQGWNAGTAISSVELVEFFGEMGYDPDTLHLEGITRPVVSIEDI